MIASGNRFELAAVEHLTTWPMAMATANNAAQVVLSFAYREIVYSFGLSRATVSDNATSFTASAVTSFMPIYGMTWRTVLVYAPMSNSQAERMVGTFKTAVQKTVLKTRMEWDNLTVQVSMAIADAPSGMARRVSSCCAGFHLR